MAMAPGSNPGRGANVQWFSIRWAAGSQSSQNQRGGSIEPSGLLRPVPGIRIRRRRHDLHRCGARRSAPVDPGQLRDKFASQGLDAAPSTAEAFTAHIRAEVPKWIRVAKVPTSRWNNPMILPSENELAALVEFDTPTICNALEVV